MGRRNIILGTDWGTDCDDAVAVRLAVRAMKQGKINLMGIVINTCIPESAASLVGFLNTEGMRGIPIGLDFHSESFEPTYQKRLVQYAPEGTNNSCAEDGVSLYRRLLSDADEPVEIMEIGFLQVIAGLLKSKPDEFSPLNGVELVKNKVKKIWMMAGRWDENPGKEYNFSGNPLTREGAAEFCKFCPVPVTFLGFEAGNDVLTGGCLAKEDVLHQVLKDYGFPDGRSSWDPMLVAMAIEGDEEKAGYTLVRGHASVDAETGCNRFRDDVNGLHGYVVRRFEASWYEKQIKKMII